ncbi:MAG: hypothetical protein H7Y03_06450 [Chitinophagaceae bacterium]|nr:hypothetical protein [Chitinophagaceae bacterium]
MKTVYLSIVLLAAIASCSSPMPITGNPNDATSTPGTTGSSRMTEQMPNRREPDPIKQADTLGKKKDSLPQ